MTDQEEIARRHTEMVIQAAARMLFKAAVRVLNTDPHQWSTRPCETCRIVTALTGERFGCDAFRFREEMSKRP